MSSFLFSFYLYSFFPYLQANLWPETLIQMDKFFNFYLFTLFCTEIYFIAIGKNGHLRIVAVNLCILLGDSELVVAWVLARKKKYFLFCEDTVLLANLMAIYILSAFTPKLIAVINPHLFAKFVKFL